MIELTGDSLTIEEIVVVYRHRMVVAPLGEEIQKRMQRCHAWTEQLIHQSDQVIYGVNTGYGSLATQRIHVDEAQRLSRNLILLCCCGVSRPLAADVVRAMMVIRANMLANGLSGVRPIVATALVDMLNSGITPYVPSQGSLGASGDLAPLAILR
jgi:histidine ammonia-lyase